MDIQIRAKNIDLGEAFRSHAEDRLNAAADKYFSRLTAASVTVSKEGHLFAVECNLQAPTGANMHSRALAPEVYSSFDQAAEKLEKQLRRYKRRITNHHDSSQGGGGF